MLNSLFFNGLNQLNLVETSFIAGMLARDSAVINFDSKNVIN